MQRSPRATLGAVIVVKKLSLRHQIVTLAKSKPAGSTSLETSRPGGHQAPSTAVMRVIHVVARRTQKTRLGPGGICNAIFAKWTNRRWTAAKKKHSRH